MDVMSFQFHIACIDLQNYKIRCTEHILLWVQIYDSH